MGWSLSRRITAVGAALLAVTAVSGQQQQSQQRPPVFRGESVLVTVDVYPQKDSRIVEGLKAEDFQILEDGKPQSVETIEFVRVEPTLSESERRDPNSIREMLQLAADPHVRVFVVFLDRVHVSVEGSHITRRPLVDSLNRIIGPNDLFGVMTQDTDPRALTLGRRLISIEEQLTKYWTWGERNRVGTDPTDPMEPILRDCFSVHPKTGMPWMIDDNGQGRLFSEILFDRRREDRTLTALERLVDHLAGIREARTVALLITEGWRLFNEDRRLAELTAEFGPARPTPVGVLGGRMTLGNPTAGERGANDLHTCVTEATRLAGLENERRLRDLTVRANRANVSFYPVNPLGLVTFDTPISTRSQPSLTEDFNRLRNRQNALQTLAGATDGIAIVNTNDIAAGMKRIIDDVSAYYLLGYYSTNTAHDGRYRRIEVKTKTPGLHVRARRGYHAPSNKPTRGVLAVAPAGPEPPKGMEEALGELGRLRLAADVFTRGAIVGDHLQVVVEIASSRAGAATWSAGADVQVIVAPEGGAALAPVKARIEPNTRGVALTVPLPAAAKSARVVAKVSAGGESFEDTLELKQGMPGIVGDAVLYRGRPAATSPLRPVADLQFRRTERVHVEWAISSELDQRSARLLSKSGQPLAIPVAVTEREAEGRRVIAADVNLAPLSPGDYVIELSVSRAGAEPMIRLMAFRVVQ